MDRKPNNMMYEDVIFTFCDNRNNLHKAEIVRKEAEKHLDTIHDICPVTCENA